MEKKWTALATIVALALGGAVAGCDPGSDSVEEANRTGVSSGAEEAKPDESEGLVDDDTFGEEGIIDDDTFGEEGLIDDDF